MRTILETLLPSLLPTFDRFIAWAGTMNRSSLAWGGFALGAVLLLSVNLLASTALRGWKADLTADNLFTISDGTKQILKSLDEPITARVYFSKKLGEASPEYQRYFDRVRALLEQYRDISGDRFQVTFIDPEPFSDAEDRAVAAGLKGLRLSTDGEAGYFGMDATNSTDNQQIIAHFSPNREGFLEYDVSKVINALLNPRKRVVGLITGLPMDGGMSAPNMMAGQQAQPTPPWLIMEQIREFFEVKMLEQNATEIPKDIDVLMVAQPVGLTPKAAYAIDQFAIKGGKVLVFIDPVPEAAQLSMLQKGTAGRVELSKMLAGWGLAFDASKVAGDIKNARRVQFGGKDGQPMVTEFVPWISMTKDNVAKDDVLGNGIDLINVASAGILSRVDGATIAVTPLLMTSPDSMVLDSKKVGFGADPLGLLRDYQPTGRALSVAVRLGGTASSAFPKGRPDEAASKDAAAKPDDPAKKADAEPVASTGDAMKDHVAQGALTAIVIADSDILHDRMWADQRPEANDKGQPVTQVANNAAFVVGALENLSGNNSLTALRARGVNKRPFTVVDNLRRGAERQFREKESELTNKLQSLTKDLAKLETTSDTGKTLLTETEQVAVDKFKGQVLETRRELRAVKHELSKDIEALDGWLKFVNIALVPLLIGFGGLAYSFWRSRQRLSN
jgi:ABC-type uncharacterized transport system involved in gliding motility auxiliary subunit